MTWETQPDPINMISQSGEMDVSLAEVVATNSTFGRTLADRFADVLNVKDFGATGDGSTNDTDAIQDAIDEAVSNRAGTIVFPYGAYLHTALTCEPASAQTHINFLGLGGAASNGVKLLYSGAGGTAFTIKNNTRYRFENLCLVDGGTGAIGLLLTSLTEGSNHGPATFTNVLLSGFTTNLQAGDEDEAASELSFINFESTAATTGVLVKNRTSGVSYTTNIRFYGLQVTLCDTAFVASGDAENGHPQILIKGGAFGRMTTRDIDLQLPGVYNFEDIYTEEDLGGPGQFIRSGSATPGSNSEIVTNVRLVNIRTSFASSPGSDVALFYQPGNYMVENCLLQTGGIELGGFDGGGGARKSNLIVRGSTIVATPPITYKADSNTLWNVRLEGNGYAAVEAQNMFADRHYVIRTDGTEHNIETKYFDWGAAASTLDNIGIYTDGDTTPSVVGTNVLVITNAGAVTITNFDDGFSGQEVTLQFSDANTTIQDNANVQLSSGANFVSTANDTLTLIKSGSVWFEKGRSLN
jgi:hypothetical protein